MLMRGSSESKDETTVQSSNKTMIRSNFDRRNPSLPVATVLTSHPIPAITAPLALAATECGAKMT
jgi:hypothetical protein